MKKICIIDDILPLCKEISMEWPCTDKAGNSEDEIDQNYA